MCVGFSMMVAGLAFLALGGFLANGVWMMLRLATRTRARVVGYVESRTNQPGESPSSYAKLQFTDTQGQEHVVTLTQTSKLPLPGFMLWEGQEVPILYDPGNPSKVQVDTFLWKWSMPLLLALVGIGLGIGGFFTLQAELAAVGPRRLHVNVVEEFSTLGKQSFTRDGQTFASQATYLREDNDLTVVAQVQLPPEQVLRPAFVLLAKLPDQAGHLQSNSKTSFNGALSWQGTYTTSAGKEYVIRHIVDTKTKVETVQLGDKTYPLAAGRVLLVDLANSENVEQLQTDVSDLLARPDPQSEDMRQVVEKLKRRLPRVREFLGP
jgi:hypothetical protein